MVGVGGFVGHAAEHDLRAEVRGGQGWPQVSADEVGVGRLVPEARGVVEVEGRLALGRDRVDGDALFLVSLNEPHQVLGIRGQGRDVGLHRAAIEVGRLHCGAGGIGAAALLVSGLHPHGRRVGDGPEAEVGVDGQRGLHVRDERLLVPFDREPGQRNVGRGAIGLGGVGGDVGSRVVERVALHGVVARADGNPCHREFRPIGAKEQAHRLVLQRLGGKLAPSDLVERSTKAFPGLGREGVVDGHVDGRARRLRPLRGGRPGPVGGRDKRGCHGRTSAASGRRPARALHTAGLTAARTRRCPSRASRPARARRSAGATAAARARSRLTAEAGAAATTPPPPGGSGNAVRAAALSAAEASERPGREAKEASADQEPGPALSHAPSPAFPL